MKNQSLKIGLLSALGISCLVGIGSLMNQEIQFYANEAVGDNGVYTLTLQNDTSVVDGVVKTNLGNNVPLSISEGVTFNSDDSFATLPTSTKIYSASSGFQVIKSLQVFYQGSKLGYQLSKTSGDESNIVSFDSGTKVYMLNQYQHFTLKNIGTESSNITKIVVEYGCNGSLDGNMFNYTTGGSSYWDIATDEEGVTSITSNYDSTDSKLNLAAFMTLKGVRMGVGTVAYDIYFDSTQGKTAFGNLKGFATNVKSETTVYGGDYISSGVLSAADSSTTDGRVMTYGFTPTNGSYVGWAHVNSNGDVINPSADFNGTSVKNDATTRIITQVENSLDHGKIITNYIETAGGYSAKYVTNKDLSAFTGSCVGLQLQQKGLKVSNVVITSLDEVDSIIKADGSEVAVKPKGEGTQESPYLISSISNYLWFLEKAASSTSHFKLTSDLDLSNKASYAMANSQSAGTAFKGTFDGNGHKIVGISSLFITTTVAAYPSVFGYVTGGTIKNLTLDVKFESSVDKTAGFASCLTGGTISNCTLNGLIYGIGTSGGVGGFVGYAASGQANIDNCLNYATIRNSSASGNTFAGGIVASSEASSKTVSGAKLLISNCKNYGNVYANGSFVGGIIGLYRAVTNNVITSCYNFGDISGIVATNAQVSGIAGNNRNTINSSLVFENCLINNKLASTFTTLGTSSVQGYLVGKLDGTGKLGAGNGLCDINGNAL